MPLKDIEEELTELEAKTIVGDPINTHNTDTNTNNNNNVNTKDKSNKRVDKQNKQSRLSSGKSKIKIKCVGLLLLLIIYSVLKKGPSNQKKLKKGISSLNSVLSSTTSTQSVKKALQGLLVLQPRRYSTIGTTTLSEQLIAENSLDKSNIDSSSQLIVGRSSQQNMRVSFRIAKESDLWFHVQVRFHILYSTMLLAFLRVN